jgi:succinoglycan biosynthesis transport protein ExoP
MQDDETRAQGRSVEEEAEALDLRRQGYPTSPPLGHARSSWRGDAGSPGSTLGERGSIAGRETAHLRDYWRIVRRRLWIPISLLLLVVTLTTIYNLRLPSIYEAVTRIEIGREDRAVNVKDLQINMAGGDDTQYLNTQLKILQSPRIAFLVAKRLDLEHNAEFSPELARPLNLQEESVAISSGESDEEADLEKLEGFVNMLLANLEIRPVRDTRLVEIRFRHRSPELARKIANSWAEAYRDNHFTDVYNLNKDSGRFLTKTINDYKIKVQQSEERLLNFRRANEVIDFGERENTVIARLATLNQSLLQAENERKNAQLLYEMSREIADVTTLPEIQRDPMIQDLNKKLTELRTGREQLLVEFTPEWPDVKKIDQQIAQLEGEFRAAQQRILSTMENQYRAAVQREAAFRKAFNEQRSETLAQSEGAIQAKMLQQEIDTNRQMLDRLLQSQQGVELSTAGLLRNSIRVTEYGSLPRSPVAPKRGQNILFSAVLALLAGLGLVLFLDYVNNKIESVEDVDRYLRLPALGVIPLLENGTKGRRLLGTGGNGAGKTLSRPSANGNLILTQVEANSSMAESYRQLRTSLLLSSAGHAPRTILFTSSQPAEGKTTTAVNTAISLAQTGAAVLVVDADLRRPRVHRIFSLKNTQGLSNFLAGEGELSNQIQIAMPNLYVLPVGPLPPNPAELLGSARMKQVIETLAANFDHVIIDSPPVASFADSLILSSMVEGVVLVIKGGMTPREMAQRTQAHLLGVGARILGVVINQIKLQPHDYYYYSTYYSRYYYGEDKEEEEGKKAGDGAVS